MRWASRYRLAAEMKPAASTTGSSSRCRQGAAERRQFVPRAAKRPGCRSRSTVRAGT